MSQPSSKLSVGLLLLLASAIIPVAHAQNLPPFFVSPQPTLRCIELSAPNMPFAVMEGTTLTFIVTAADLDTGDVVTLGVTYFPIDIAPIPPPSFPIPAPSNPVSSILTYTPPIGLTGGTPKGFIAEFTATDTAGNSVPCSVGIKIFPPPLRTADVDISPGREPNVINLRSHSLNPRSHSGMVRVAVLSSPGFDALAQVDASSLTFGKTGNEQSLISCKSPRDVNADGLLDLVCRFDGQRAGFSPGDAEGVLRGRLVNGTPIEGKDSVLVKT